MTSEDSIRQRLAEVVAATEGAATAIEPPSYWEGDKAGKRRVLDDLRSGRLAWRRAHLDALAGLKALHRGEGGLAEAFMREAEGHYVSAQMNRPQKKGKAALTTSAKRRGRKRTTEERNRKLAEAVAMQEARGLVGSAALAAAYRADPALKAEFKGLLRPAVSKALRDGKKKRN